MARILIIDDDSPTRRMLRQALEYAGHSVVEAQDGRQGIQHHRTMPVDLILTDILMPEKEGLETIMELRRDFPGLKIIAMSGGLDTGQFNFLTIAQKLGAHTTLRKPFGLQEMLNTIQQVLHD